MKQNDITYSIKSTSISCGFIIAQTIEHGLRAYCFKALTSTCNFSCKGGNFNFLAITVYEFLPWRVRIILIECLSFNAVSCIRIILIREIQLQFDSIYDSGLILQAHKVCIEKYLHPKEVPRLRNPMMHLLWRKMLS